MAEDEKSGEPAKDKNELQILKVLALAYIARVRESTRCRRGRVLLTCSGIGAVFRPSYHIPKDSLTLL